MTWVPSQNLIVNLEYKALSIRRSVWITGESVYTVNVNVNFYNVM